MTEPDQPVPVLSLDPDGVPLDVVDLAGEPRRFTAWGIACAQDVRGLTAALVISDSEDPPTRGDAWRLAAALDGGRADALAAHLDQQLDRVMGLAEELRDTQHTLSEVRATLARYREELGVVTAERDAARRVAVVSGSRLRPRRWFLGGGR